MFQPVLVIKPLNVTKHFHSVAQQEGVGAGGIVPS